MKHFLRRTFMKDKMRKKIIISILIVIFIIGIFYMANPISILEKIFNTQPEVDIDKKVDADININSDINIDAKSNTNSSSVIIPPSKPIAVPKTSASAITSPPSSMVGINTHTELFGGDADPDVVTLGPKFGSHPDWNPYPTQHSTALDFKHGTPILAPIDMVFVGFQNNNAKYDFLDGQKITPANDLMLVFESASPDWPSMLIKIYHLYSSPLLRGHYQNPDCGESENPGDGVQTKGHLTAAFGDGMTVEKGDVSACEPLFGYKVKRGELIGFAGSVGKHSFAAFAFKVSDTSVSPIVKEGNPYLHWVQPSAFFYWKCYNPNANFFSGVLAYPFECDGYQLPAEQRDVNFKYTLKK